MLPYILSADDLGDFFGVCRKPYILEADDFLKACDRKAVTPKKLWTLTFSPESGVVWKRRLFTDGAFSREFRDSGENLRYIVPK